MVQMIPGGRSLGVFALLLLLANLTGCGSSLPAKPDRFYRLAPVPLEGPGGAPVPAILLVNNLAARGFLGGRAGRSSAPVKSP